MSITRKKAEQIVNESLELCKQLLKLTKYKITVHILHTKSVFLRKNGAKPQGEMASCYGSEYSKSADIIIHYDKHPNDREVLSSLIHELLHLKFAKLSELVTLKQRKAHNIEENLVRDFEELIMQFLDNSHKLVKRIKKLSKER
jgi:hypothetical protein